jgi:Fur family ferric uptake transcriptional regulator
MLAAEQVQSVALPSGETRYKIAGPGHSDHFQCRACHGVFALSACPVHLSGGACANGAVLPQGFIVEDHAVTLYGLCADCAKN